MSDLTRTVVSSFTGQTGMVTGLVIALLTYTECNIVRLLNRSRVCRTCIVIVIKAIGAGGALRASQMLGPQGLCEQETAQP